MSTPIKKGDFVRFRDDATSEGKPIGELFRQLTWRVVRVHDDTVELAARYLQSDLTLHTFTRKMRHATAEEMPS